MKVWGDESIKYALSSLLLSHAYQQNKDIKQACEYAAKGVNIIKMQEKINVEVILALLYWCSTITKPSTALKLLNFLISNLDACFDIIPPPVIMSTLVERKRDILKATNHEISREDGFFYDKIQQQIQSLSPKQVETCIADFDRYLICCVRLDKLSGIDMEIGQILFIEQLEWIE